MNQHLLLSFSPVSILMVRKTNIMAKFYTVCYDIYRVESCVEFFGSLLHDFNKNTF